MPRRTHTSSDCKQNENIRRAQEKRLQQVRTELQAQWRSGEPMPTDILSVVRAAEQRQMQQKQLRRRRREETRRRRQGKQQAAE